MQIRTYLLIDQMQPQYGALTGKTMQGEIPVEGMAEIYIETAPASDIYKVMDMAQHGYFCLLPDMYYRLGTIRFDLPRRNDPMSAVIRAAMNHLTNADVTDDTGGLIAWLDAQDKVKAGPVGCVGHCMSGRYITTVAARFPTRMAAAASLYGVGIVTDQSDSPHLLLDKVQGELYYGFAETDASVPAHVIPELRKALERADTKYKLEVLPGTQHGFCFDERQVYYPVAAEQAWARLFDLWDRNLKQ